MIYAVQDKYLFDRVWNCDNIIKSFGGIRLIKRIPYAVPEKEDLSEPLKEEQDPPHETSNGQIYRYAECFG